MKWLFIHINTSQKLRIESRIITTELDPWLVIDANNVGRGIARQRETRVRQKSASHCIRWQFMWGRALETHNGFAQTFAIVDVIRVVTQVGLWGIREALLARGFIGDTSGAL